MDPPHDGDLDRLLEYVHERRNFDFRGYKRASLSRRIAKRMQAVGAEDYQRYMEVLEANPGEFGQLFDTILINVTSLRRDREAWDALADSVIPSLVQSKEPEDPIRVWSAGCASGEEAYTLAVLFAENLGEERFRRSVKIYATDADEDALSTARQARYAERDLIAAFGEEVTGRFFDVEEEQGTFRAELRRALIFGRHDLVQDPPISRLDLIVCRNTLMYFTAEIQIRVLGSFQFALVPGGHLFLGKSEALAIRTGMFEVVNLRQHLFQKSGRQPDVGTLLPPAPGRPSTQRAPSQLVEQLFEQSAVAELVVDSRGILVLANREARRMFSLGSSDIGRPLVDLEVMRRPIDLRQALDQASREHRGSTVHDVRAKIGADQEATLDISIAPVGHDNGAVIAFVDVSRYQQLRDQLQQSQRQLESAYEELQSAVEELETTNEELQSTNEELETTNEELQSTNEELETMNEELQSTNEELETINNELSDRNDEVDDLNQFLESILGSLQSAVVVIDPEMEVRAWNRRAEDLWGLRSDEVLGQHFLNLDMGFPIDRLRNDIRDLVTSRAENARVIERAVNRRGRPIICTVTLSRLRGGAGARGVIIMMDAELVEEAVPIPHVAPTNSDGSSEDGHTEDRHTEDGHAADGHAEDGHGRQNVELADDVSESERSGALGAD